MEENILTKKDFATVASRCMGKIVTCISSTGFRPNEKAEIIGWCMVDNKPYFTIRFEDNETTLIPLNSEEYLEDGVVMLVN